MLQADYIKSSLAFNEVRTIIQLKKNRRKGYLYFYSRIFKLPAKLHGLFQVGAQAVVYGAGKGCAFQYLLLFIRI